jgi:hypothetical protein
LTETPLGQNNHYFIDRWTVLEHSYHHSQQWLTVQGGKYFVYAAHSAARTGGDYYGTDFTA